MKLIQGFRTCSFVFAMGAVTSLLFHSVTLQADEPSSHPSSRSVTLSSDTHRPLKEIKNFCAALSDQAKDWIQVELTCEFSKSFWISTRQGSLPPGQGKAVQLPSRDGKLHASIYVLHGNQGSQRIQLSPTSTKMFRQLTQWSNSKTGDTFIEKIQTDTSAIKLSCNQVLSMDYFYPDLSIAELAHEVESNPNHELKFKIRGGDKVPQFVTREPLIELCQSEVENIKAGIKKADSTVNSEGITVRFSEADRSTGEVEWKVIHDASGDASGDASHDSENGKSKR